MSAHSRLTFLLIFAVLLGTCRWVQKAPPDAPKQADLLDITKPKDWRHFGLGGSDCPDGKEKKAIAKMLADYPASKYKGGPLVGRAICRYLAGDKEGAKADLKTAEALPKDDNGDTLLQATLFLVEATANDTKAAIGLDLGRKQALADAKVLDDNLSKKQGDEIRAGLKGKKLYDEAELAGLRIRQDALRDFVHFLIDAKPSYQPARNSERYLDDVLGPRAQREEE